MFRPASNGCTRSTLPLPQIIRTLGRTELRLVMTHVGGLAASRAIIVEMVVKLQPLGNLGEDGLFEWRTYLPS